MDKNTAWSPAPWSTKLEQMRIDNSRIIYGANGLHVAYAADFNRYDRDAEADANAVLISVAPEMADALMIFTDITKQLEHTPMDYFIYRLDRKDMEKLAAVLTKLMTIPDMAQIMQLADAVAWLPSPKPDRPE